MAYPPRIQYPGAWHHVMNRGASRQNIFLDDFDRDRFVSLLAKSFTAAQIEIHAYCLMSNHFHLLVRTNEQSLDGAMQRLASRYVREFNKRHGRDGPLFRSRYRSLLVQHDNYLLAVSRYIHRNPTDLGVTNLEDFEWSSLSGYVDRRRAPRWLHTAETLQQIGGSNSYRAFVHGPFSSEFDEIITRTRPPIAFGDAKFRQATESRLEEQLL